MNNKELQTDLFEAIDAGNLRRVEVLIDMGVNVGGECFTSALSGPAYTTPLPHAINRRNTDIVELLYKASGRNGIISEEDLGKARQYFDALQALKFPFQVREEIPVKEPEFEAELQSQEKPIKKVNKGAKK